MDARRAMTETLRVPVAAAVTVSTVSSSGQRSTSQSTTALCRRE